MYKSITQKSGGFLGMTYVCDKNCIKIHKRYPLVPQQKALELYMQLEWV